MSALQHAHRPSPTPRRWPTIILHIATRGDWNAAMATGLYHTASIESTGFIHCSDIHQMLDPANSLFRGRKDLILLLIDPNSCAATVHYEDCYDEGQAFPHLYGPLETTAVVAVLPFTPDANGYFSLPAEVSG